MAKYFDPLNASWLLSFSAFLALAATSQPDCTNQQCGNVSSISFPFSLDPSCPAFSPGFRLVCNSSHGRETLLLNTSVGPYPVLHIHNDSLIIDITSAKAVINATLGCSIISPILSLGFDASDPFVISQDNQLGSFSCDSIGYMVTGNVTNWDVSHGDYEVLGCAVTCPENAFNSDCGKKNCCVTPDLGPNDVRSVAYFTSSSSNSTCSADFSILFHPSFTDFETYFGLKVLWALLYQNNDTNAITKTANYACSEYAEIVLVSQVPGYLCRCGNGFEGDGYAKGSPCTDINECSDSQLNDCISGTICHNSIGGYSCHCNSKFRSGDGTHRGSGCRLSPTWKKAFSIAGGLLGAIIVASFIIFFVNFWRRRRRRRYFCQNGGLQLQDYISRSGRGSARLFSVEELQSATRNFSEQLKLGVGGYGAVFQGTLKDGRMVAVKKANRSGDDDHQFLNEVSILTQINHRHIVRLLGCCLETATPLLVYEFVSNGTLSEHLQAERKPNAPASGKDHVPVMGWQKRLQIASQTAEALAYLHAAAAPPILHRDVKSSNILLDDNLEAKVADFGVSRLVPEGAEHVSTAVQGTIGYLDPEYFQTLQLTDKSDVYSLGVVLVELITGLKPVDNYSRQPEFANLTLFFINRMREGRLEELIDQRIMAEEEAEVDSRRREENHATVVEVARVARSCLALQGAQRPSMREVAEELRSIEKELAAGLKAGAAGEGEAVPLLWSRKAGQPFIEESVGGAVVAAKDEFFVQSSSLPTSATVTVDPVFLRTATPR